MARARLAPRPFSWLLTFYTALAGCATAARRSPTVPPPQDVPMRLLAIPVGAAENRPVSFTNKRSAYYYTQTHRNDSPEHAWFRGLNIAGRRVFNDYQVLVRGAPLDPAGARVLVRPDALVRTYPQGVTETLQLFDDRDVVEVVITGARGPVQLRLSGDNVRPAGTGDGVDWYVSSSGADPGAADQIAVGRSGDRFLIAVAASRQAALALFREAAAHAPEWESERRARLEGLVTGDHYIRTDAAALTEALRWIALTTDELVTRQRGDGIYAGLPWFNEYWGRDSFISLAGATLVTGHFEEARAILVSFAKFQDLDKGSEFYGRLPNIVKPGSIDYHTTDGTPRCVIALREYVRYSGDRSIIGELYANVAASIEGSFAHWTDSAGYLVHADNETWMDARRSSDLVPYSPRGNRANDIQALWYEQLRVGAEFAATMGDTAAAGRWARAALRLREHFVRDFVDVPAARIADRLDARDVPDFTLRPNLLFALDLVEDRQVATRATRTAWEALVYPWGVATLDQAHPFFHPYHLAWEHYHKDEAYHNGTVWPWLNGIAMQRMIEDGQTEPAWRLFQNMNELALRRGVVGGLTETMDACPHPGERWPRLTGAFLQAWSNAEHLRVWYQYFLGVRPDMVSDRVLLAPRLPADLNLVEFTARIGAGSIHAAFDTVAGGRRYVYRLAGQPATLTLDIAPFAIGGFAASAGDVLVAEIRPDGLHARLESGSGVTRDSVVLPVSAERRARQAALDTILDGTRFAEPDRADSHPVMKQVYRRDR
jgi:glycogen debranching enzyme